MPPQDYVSGEHLVSDEYLWISQVMSNVASLAATSRRADALPVHPIRQITRKLSGIAGRSKAMSLPSLKNIAQRCQQIRHENVGTDVRYHVRKTAHYHLPSYRPEKDMAHPTMHLSSNYLVRANHGNLRNILCQMATHVFDRLGLFNRQRGRELTIFNIYDLDYQFLPERLLSNSSYLLLGFPTS